MKTLNNLVNGLCKEKNKPNLRMLMQLFNYSPIDQEYNGIILILKNPETQQVVFYNTQSDQYAKPGVNKK